MDIRMEGGCGAWAGVGGVEPAMGFWGQRDAAGEGFRRHLTPPLGLMTFHVLAGVAQLVRAAES